MQNDDPRISNSKLEDSIAEDSLAEDSVVEDSGTKNSKVEASVDAPAQPSAGSSFSELLLDLVFSIIIPTLILKKMSGDDMLGPTWALVFALSFPALAGIWGFYKKGKITFIPALGFISILLTGGIGVLKLPKEYIAYKEAMVPTVLGLITVVSAYTGKPIIRPFVMNDALMDVNKIDSALKENKTTDDFNQSLVNATWIISASFVFSAVANYFLAKWVVVSESGTDAFNSELGTIAVYGYLMIGLPATIFTIAAAVYAFKSMIKHTGLSFEELFREDMQ